MKNKTERVLQKIYYWEDFTGKYYIQFEYNIGASEVYVVDRKEFAKIKKKYKDLVVRDV